MPTQRPDLGDLKLPVASLQSEACDSCQAKGLPRPLIPWKCTPLLGALRRDYSLSSWSYYTANLLCRMSWSKWRLDAVFERVQGKYPAHYRFSHWHGDGGVDHEAPSVGPRGNAEYRDINIRYWSSTRC
ncbi:hypothetical protein FA13DRAFT_1736729 [Coprinellus micaceus]|uniref:Uncharacterized protein n=1 Tax=Coprinellus micaceus TaxID=71717 RepID=A0A4Y7SZ59_COPMI|nr:hypothetical protein FA13DRAFT_1736729 [Coprinellus micaceus]